MTEIAIGVTGVTGHMGRMLARQVLDRVAGEPGATAHGLRHGVAAALWSAAQGRRSRPRAGEQQPIRGE